MIVAADGFGNPDQNLGSDSHGTIDLVYDGPGVNVISPSAPVPLIPAEVWEFAREQAIDWHLARLVEMSHRIFPTASRFQILLEADPEIADDKHIVFFLTVPLDVGESLDADRSWIEGLNRLCPKPKVCVFRLTLDLEP